MSKQASSTLIGTFVLGAIALLVVFVLIIGGESFNRPTERYVVYFDESVNGLGAGSNVMFRGVPIGFVRSVELEIDATTLEIEAPVYIETYQNVIAVIPGTEPDDPDILNEDSFERLLDAGLRASLKPESLITGQLYIELDFYPDEKAIMRGQGGAYREIPSISTGIQRILKSAQNMVAEMQDSVDIKQAAKDFQETLKGINRLVSEAEDERVLEELSSALRSIDGTFTQADQLLTSASGEADEVAASLANSLAELEQLLTTVNDNLDASSKTSYRIDATLREIEDAARAIRLLAEYLERNPEALIQGKPED